MPAKTWRQVMWITAGEPAQKYLDELLGPLECEHFKGNYWSKDQETIYNQLSLNGWPVVKDNRTNGFNSFATRRNDRDGWLEVSPAEYLIDAHLPRPGYTEENFSKIFNLFRQMYPYEDLNWMVEYRNEFIKHL